MAYLVGYPTPQDYGAVGNGTTDDTAAINSAISAVQAAGGGSLYFPPATYAVTPVSSTSAAIKLNNGTTGYNGVRLIGSSSGGSHLKKLAAGPILALAGPSTDTTGATHCKYCSVENLYLDGNGLTGTMLQCYYADDLLFRDVHFVNNADVVLDSAEFWDSRFYNCVWDSCGSATANATAPNVWLRDSAAASGFGASTDTVNQIYFHGCRWEAFHTGAVRIEQGVSNSGQPSSVFFTDCKMESVVINGGPHLYVDANCMGIEAKHLYCYCGGFNGGYSTAQDVIVFGPQFGTLDDVFIFNASATACIADGVTVNAPLSTGTVALRNIRGKYNTAPTGSHINFGTMTGAVLVDNCSSDSGAQFGGSTPSLAGEAAVVSSTTVANSAALSTLQSYTVPAGEPHAGSVYQMRGYGFYSVTGTPTMAFTLYWGGIGGTAIASIPTITAASGISFASFEYDVVLTFRSATSVTAELTLTIVTNTSTGATSRYVGVPASATTVTTASASALAVGFQWGAASASNTITLFGGRTARLQ